MHDLNHSELISFSNKPHTPGPHSAILDELDGMLRELNREIKAYGQTRAMSLEVLRDLLEESRDAQLEHDIR